MNKKLRFQLTAWYLAFFSVLFVLLGLVLYGVLSRSLERRLEEALLTQANTAAALMREELEEMHGDAQAAASGVLPKCNPAAASSRSCGTKPCWRPRRRCPARIWNWRRPRRSREHRGLDVALSIGASTVLTGRARRHHWRPHFCGDGGRSLDSIAQSSRWCGTRSGS